MNKEQGSLQKAVDGDYNISVGTVLSEAWSLVKGIKLQFFGAFVIYLVIAIIVSALISMFLDAKPYYDADLYAQGFATDILAGWLASPVTVPLSLGFLLLGYARANGEERSIQSIFDYYILVWPLVFAAISVSIITYLGYLFFILPGIYFSIAYLFALPLMIDKKLGVWAAMEVSRRAVTKHWFSIFGVNISLFILVMLSAIPLGIGLFWTVPMMLIAQGVMYRTIFGWKVDEVLET